MSPARGFIDREVGHVLAEPVLREHGVGQVVENVHLIVEVDGEHGMGEIAHDVADHDQPQLLGGETELAQADVFGDGIVFAVPGQTERLERRRPIVAAAIVLIVRPVAPIV
jgi:hypothetical protein